VIRPVLPSVAFVTLLLIASPSAPVLALHLDPIGSYQSGLFDEGGAEIPAYHPPTKRLFVVNGGAATLDILDLTDPAAPTPFASLDMEILYGGGANSVAISGDVVAVAVEASPKQDPGQVVFLDPNGAFLGSVPVGALPDMLMFTSGGMKVLVANEGEPSGDYDVDPEGTLSIIDLSNGVASATVHTISLVPVPDQGPYPGLRIFGPNASMAQDLEPESVAVSSDGTTAWVACQENNAFVLVDLTTETAIDILPLGWKNHSLAGRGLDASDRAAAIDIRTWPLFGMYLPDALEAIDGGGTTYLVSANEGDIREYPLAPFLEAKRVKDLVLDPVAFPNAAALKTDAQLGRLNVTTTQGDLGLDGDFDQLYAFGGRSFSVWDAAGALVWDSGDQLEQITAAAYPDDFNSNNDGNNSWKKRSDDKGPEPEGLRVANLFGRHYLFVGLERIGGIVVFDLTDPTAPVFVEYVNHRDFDGVPGAGTALDLGPEGIAFISAADGPDGRALLAVSNEVSGSTTIYEVLPSTAGGPEDSDLSSTAALLATPWPNPSTAEVRLAFVLPRDEQVSLSIHDVQGRLIRSLADESRTPGRHEISWDGLDMAGRPVSAGAYFARLAAESAVRVVPVIRLGK